MTASFVVDASVALSWLLGDEATRKTEALLDEIGKGALAVAPHLLPYEVANGLLMACRTKRITTEQMERTLQIWQQVPVRWDEPSFQRVNKTVAELAVKYQLTVYDAAYLELAKREAIPLASKDKKLNQAARKAKVGLVMNQ